MIWLIVVSYNSYQDISDLIESCRSWIDTDQLKVVLAENGSSIEKEKFIDLGIEVVLHFPENLGYGAAINRLVNLNEIANNDIVWIINPDTTLVNLPKFADVLALGRDEVIIPTINNQGLRYISRKTYRVVSRVTPIPFIDGASFLLSKKSFADLGGFSERFWMYYEDVDLSIRAKDLNKKVSLTPLIQIRHYVHGSQQEAKGISGWSRKNPKADFYLFWGFRNWLLVILGRKVRFFALIFYVIIVGKKLLEFIVKGKEQKAILRGILSAIKCVR